jgi:hypothetical protein
MGSRLSSLSEARAALVCQKPIRFQFAKVKGMTNDLISFPAGLPRNSYLAAETAAPRSWPQDDEQILRKKVHIAIVHRRL